jgi:hypothetical protein
MAEFLHGSNKSFLNLLGILNCKFKQVGKIHQPLESSQTWKKKPMIGTKSKIF